MKYLKPKKLIRGDLIGIISPASAVVDDKLVQKGINYLEGLGYRTEIGKNVGKVRGYLAGTDEERVQDIHRMFSDKRVKAIFCLRGGYGAFRLLDKIDYKLIRNNPKIFVGFSEITALQMAFLCKSNLISYAGPMVASNFSNEISSYTEENFWRIISSDKKPGRLELSSINSLSKIKTGEVSGKLIGGNVSVFTSLLGSGYLPKLKNKILLIEEISEPPYKIDRMLNQLRLNKVFKEIKGILLGNFLDCEEPDKTKSSLTIDEVWSDYFSSLKIPAIHSIPHGHSKNILTLPIGINVKLNIKKGRIEFLENAVM